MQLEVGAILEGKITGVKKFGAFVALPGGKTGMVHISEVSNSFIEDLSGEGESPPPLLDGQVCRGCGVVGFAVGAQFRKCHKPQYQEE